MSAFIHLLLWNTCWAAALAVVVWVVGYSALLRHRPAVLHLLWFGVLLRLAVPSVVPIPILPQLGRPANSSSVSADSDVSPASPPSVSASR